MIMEFYTAKRVRCLECKSCAKLVACPANFEKDLCIGCKACFFACPNKAIEMVKEEREEVEIFIDKKPYSVPGRIPVKQALEMLGYRFEDGCETGGCWSCVVEIDGLQRPSCIEAVREKMKIKFVESTRRVVGGFMAHTTGGVGTPWYLKGGWVEVAAFAAGCNFRCPQCQNWRVTYRSKENFEYQVLTPKQAAERITFLRKVYGVHRIAISGGECTLNRKWLVRYIKELRLLNPDEKARFHVDTNGSLLSKDYIDELINAGMSDVGIDLKALEIDTFMRITGLSKELAMKYKRTAWNAVKYILDEHSIFLGIGIPYNQRLISLDEIQRMGGKIAEINPEVQVCVLDYRPEFRRQEILKPTYQEMVQVYKALKEVGLETAICQSVYGHIGP
jgi:pyruvate formate lyase activating enzyme